jgi:hypothetical protein
MLFPTTLVGSYPQPEWLIDREKLAKRFPPRVRARELWRIAEPFLAQAQDDAPQAATYFAESLARYHEIGHRGGLPDQRHTRAGDGRLGGV